MSGFLDQTDTTWDVIWGLFNERASGIDAVFSRITLKKRGNHDIDFIYRFLSSVY